MRCSMWLSPLLCLLILISGLQRLALASPDEPERGQEQLYSFRDNLHEIGISDNMLNYADPLFTLLRETHNNIRFKTQKHFFEVLNTNWDKESVLANSLSHGRRQRISKALSQLPLSQEYSTFKPSDAPSAAQTTLLIFEGSHPASMNKHLQLLKKKLDTDWAEVSFHIMVRALVDNTEYPLTYLTKKGALPDKVLDSWRENNAEQISQSQLTEGLFRYYFPTMPFITEIFDKKQTPNISLSNLFSKPHAFFPYGSIVLATPQPYCREASIIMDQNLSNAHSFYHFCFNARAISQQNYDETYSIAENLEALKELIKTDTKYFGKDEMN